MTTPIVAAGSVDDFFQDIVVDALRAQSVEVTEGATHYLVSLLGTFTRPDERNEAVRDRPLAFQLDEALHIAPAGERFDRLRALGDGVLYSSGFFGDHFEARGIEAGYLVGIGTTAYGAASSMLRMGSSRDLEAQAKLDIFGELAAKFAALVAVLSEVANRTVAAGVTSSKHLVKMYERYLKTRSPTLGAALTTHGFVTPSGRGRGGSGMLQ